MDDPAILDSEHLAHFILEQNKIRGDGTVHHRALMPSTKTGNKSVFRVDGLDDHVVCDLGRKEVGQPQGRLILGWADLVALDVREQKLKVRPDEPPSRHALVEGWPPAIEDQRTVAMVLAQRASLKRC